MQGGQGRGVHFSKLHLFSSIHSSFEDDQSLRVQKGYSRVVYCNDPDNPEALQLKYRNNYVSTTKYTPVNFIPKCLFEQFRRVANIYFLVVACVSFTPLAPYRAGSIVLPLLVVIGATMLKEAVEDWRRWKQDLEANSRMVKVYQKDHTFHEAKWRKLRVGDLVKVEKDEFFPADLLLVSSGHHDGSCYVETMNLDGETNLKVKRSLEATAALHDESSFQKFKAIVKCEDPNENLYSFTGSLYYDGIQYPLSPKQLLLRGSKLRNTEYIFGVVIFSDHDTKVMLNTTDSPSKRSNVERKMDKIVYFLFGVLVLISFVGSVFFGVQTKNDTSGGTYKRWYLRPDSTTVFFDPKRVYLATFFHFLTGLMLYGYLIPISLYVSIEIVKVLQTIFINHDQDMYYEETDRPARARTSNLNEDLGQVHTILSDKTGTLTCNSMEFVKCSIAGIAYGRGITEVEKFIKTRKKDRTPESVEASSDIEEHSGNIMDSRKSVKGFNFRDERIMEGKWINESNTDFIQKFFRVLAICHTAIPDVDKESGEISYASESADEAAFVIAARELGFELYERTQTTLSLHELLPNTEEKVNRQYKLLHVLEFRSSRKRMSVIVRDEENQLLLLCKGADSVMFERLSKDQNKFEVEVNTKDHINKYAAAALRTLVIAYRELDEEEYKIWEEEFLKAKTSVSADHDELVDAAADKIERDLILLGATAVEDKLQKGVPECIEKLSLAGVRLWVLTGDKMETAINIGYACSLLKEGMRQIVITLETPDIIALDKQGDKVAIAEASHECITKQLQEGKDQVISSRQSRVSCALIIDGKSLTFALVENLESSFMELAIDCASVICCRSTPKQKALVTRLMKKATGKTTLAIGDGANDVGMIKEADIGVGIRGVEGVQGFRSGVWWIPSLQPGGFLIRISHPLLYLFSIFSIAYQAALASDFAIAQFRFLERLLLVHGHWFYRRIAMMVCYFFYKEVAFGLTLFWFESHASFSGQPAYNDWYMSFYNVFFTSLPVIALGVFEQDVSARFCLEHPLLYQENLKSIFFSWARILGWMFNGVTSSTIIFFIITSSVLHQAFRRDGQVAGYEVLGVTLYTCVVWTVNCQMALTINYFTWIQHFFIWGSIIIWYIFLVIYGLLPPTISTTAYQVLVEACAFSPFYWLATFCVVISALIPYFSYKAFQVRFFPMYHEKFLRTQ